MKRLILILLVLFTTSLAYSGKEPEPVKAPATDTVTIPRAEMEKYLAQMKRDKLLIEELQKNRTSLAASNLSLKDKVRDLELQLAEDKGIFVGANIGAPLGGDGIVMYDLGKYGIYSLVGYHSTFHLDLGFMVKIK